MPLMTALGDSRANATTSAMANPMTKLMIVSGIVLVIAALASGQRLAAISCQADRCAPVCPSAAGAEEQQPLLSAFLASAS